MNWNLILPIIFIVVLAALKVPVWIAMFAGILPYFLFLEPNIPAQIIIQRFTIVAQSNSYLAIPFFVTAGAIMNYSGVTAKMFDLADLLVGRFTGGLAHVNVLLSTLMGGMSGSAAADAAMESKMLVPEMVKKGYDLEFSAAVTLGSSLITPIIPPGMGLIIFAMAAEVSVGRMFAAGYLPGLLCCVLQMIVCWWISQKRGYGTEKREKVTVKQVRKTFIAAIPALMIPLGIMMALRGGAFTATEAGAILCAYSIVIGAFVYRELKWEHAIPILKESVQGTATVMILVAAANVLSYFVTYERVPNLLADYILNSDMGKWSFLILVNIVLLFLGMVMSGSGPMLVLGPLLTPIAVKLGIDPIQFGLMMVFNLGIGNMTPPFGIVLYQVGGLLDIPLPRLVKASLPFLGVMLFVLLLICIIPGVTLWIPNLMYGP